MALLIRANASAACASIARGSVTRTATRVITIRAPMPPGRKAAIIARSASSAAAPPSPALSSPTGHRSDDIWLQEKLNEALAGLETSTRRAKVRALRVLHVSSARMSYSPKTLRPRCTALDLDLLWEARPVSQAGGPAQPLQGMARVKLSTRDYAQVQVTDVQVLDRDADADGAPSMPSGQAVPPDVLLAVQALDGAIMARFNEFLWAMEQAQAGTFPLASFELDEEHHDEQLPRFDPGVYATGA